MRPFSISLLLQLVAVAANPAQEPKVYDVPDKPLTIAGTIRPGDPTLDTAPIDDAKGSPHQVVRLRLRKNQSYVFSLISSDFDALLILQDSAAKFLGYDDDNAGQANSRFAHVVKADGEYQLLAVSLNKKPGAFQLHVRWGELSRDEKLIIRAIELDRAGSQQYRRGQAASAVSLMRQALEIRQELFGNNRFPDGHSDLASSLNNLGTVLEAAGQLELALTYYRQGLDQFQMLYPEKTHPNGNPNLANAINNMGGVNYAMGQFEQALPYYQRSMAMRERLHRASKLSHPSPEVADSLNNIAATYSAMGQVEKSLSYYRQCLEMRQRIYPPTEYPEGHVLLAQSLNNLGNTYDRIDQEDRALPHLHQCLAMLQRLYPKSRYPNGHPHLAMALGNVGGSLLEFDRPEQGIDYIHQMLAMYQTLYPKSRYPNGHPDLSRALGRVGLALRLMEKFDDSLEYYRQSLEMGRAIYPASRYPAGHPHVAQCLNSYALALESVRKMDEAMTYHRECLEMCQRLFPASKYPDGHNSVVNALSNLGAAFLTTGRVDAALPRLEESLRMQLRLLRRELATASEEAAFDRMRSQPRIRDAYLTASTIAQIDPAVVYDRLWPTRSFVTRLLEQRQANARAAGTELGARLDRLRGLRRRFDQLLQDSRLNVSERDKLLANIADERDRMERETIAAVPSLQRWTDLERLGPKDLVGALPANAVFIDIIHYTHIEHKETPARRVPRYVAFVVRPPSAGQTIEGSGNNIVRVELGDAEPIEGQVSKWRKSITDQRAESAAQELVARVWSWLAPAIPPGTTTLFFSPDGDLARLPWAALPIASDRVLLEQFTIAQIPHGTWLLDQLQQQRGQSSETRGVADSVLAIGSLNYGTSPWPALPGAATEIASLKSIAPASMDTITGVDATRERVSARLPLARFVHVASHGEFKADEFTTERKRTSDATNVNVLATESRRVAAKNPLGYVGVVLSGGEVLSGLHIVDLKLDHLKLVTLSACETGLGALSGSEGVQGLQRAFHLAGVPNVVASLWQVSDAATAALMAKFYHELWVNKKPPIEALRTAQLTIYHNPDLIPDLAGERGAPKFKEAVAINQSAGRQPPESNAEPRRADALRNGKRAPTRQWAAFVLSGVGR